MDTATNRSNPGVQASLKDGFTRRLFMTVGLASAVVILGFLVYNLAHVLLLVFAGILLAVFLGGLTDWVGRLTHLGHGWSLAIVLFVLLLVAAGGIWFLGSDVVGQVDQLIQQLPGSIEALEKNLDKSALGRTVLHQLNRLDTEMITNKALISKATGIFSSTFGILMSFLVVSMTGLYLVVHPQLYRRGIVKLVPISMRPRAQEILHTLNIRLRWWLVGRITSMTIVGIMTAVGLWLLGIPIALTLGLIAALLTFVPFIGPIVSVIPAMLLGLMKSPMMAVWVLALYIGIQLIESNLLTPLVQQRAASLPPALTIMAQTLMGALLGILGIILATPLIACLLVLVHMLYVEDTLGDCSGLSTEKGETSQPD